MPNCFQLIKISDLEPAVLQDIDNELWLKFAGSIPEPNDKWYLNWYNTVGVMLSCGRTFREIKKELSEEMAPVINYLGQNYLSRAWAYR
jgi:hypothetical protein